uniref:C-type lectin domain-containing protein n=1 Tax=Panagrellus redivivus TaxID=6233 RepID=A0A7E4UNM5_PANRE
MVEHAFAIGYGLFAICGILVMQVFVLLFLLHQVTSHSPDSTNCIILKNHPGTCLHFLTSQLYTLDEGKKACWEKYHSVPFVPISNVDVADLLERFYFHVTSNDAYKYHLGLGTQSDSNKEHFRDHLYNVIGKDTWPSYTLWNHYVYRGSLPKDNEGENRKIKVNYPSRDNLYIRDGYIRVNLENGVLMGSPTNQKSYFACHSPRYPKFHCIKDAYTDYETRTCMFAHEFPYKANTRKMAQDYCNKHDANLASIHNQREYDVYYSLITKNLPRPYTEQEKTLVWLEDNNQWVEYWFGLRHQNSAKDLEESRTPGFDDIYMKVGYFVDGTKYTGFHRFHAEEPTHYEGHEHYNGQTLTNNGWYRNYKGSYWHKGVLCRSSVDVSGAQEV